MNPDSLEGRIAGIQQQVRDLEHDVRGMMPLAAQVAVLVSDMGHLREAHAASVIETRKGQQEIYSLIASDKDKRQAQDERAADRMTATKWQRIALAVAVCIAAGGNVITVALALATR